MTCLAPPPDPVSVRRCPLFTVLLLLLLAASAEATSTCQFDTSAATMRLLADCTTDGTILIPDGVTLDGGDFTITAIDPVGGHFRGAVVMNAGAAASIVNTRITTQALADVCDGGPARLRGIFFDGAAGTIHGNTIAEITQGPSRCAEGNAIEIRSLAGDENAFVEVDHNVIEHFQKSGIVVAANVDVWIHDNRIGASANQAHLSANGIQVGYGAWALIEGNRIGGNSSTGFPATDDAATAILLFHAAPGTSVIRNAIEGNADVGIYVAADEVIVEGNELVEEGADLGGYDIGIGDYGAGNRITGNTVRGYRIPYDRLREAAVRTIAAR